MNDDEEILYGDYREPSPADVGKVLGYSGRHIKRLCERLGLRMHDAALPGSTQHRWRIPLRTFRALCAHLQGERPSAA